MFSLLWWGFFLLGDICLTLNEAVSCVSALQQSFCYVSFFFRSAQVLLILRDRKNREADELPTVNSCYDISNNKKLNFTNIRQYQM